MDHLQQRRVELALKWFDIRGSMNGYIEEVYKQEGNAWSVIVSLGKLLFLYHQQLWLDKSIKSNQKLSAETVKIIVYFLRKNIWVYVRGAYVNAKLPL